MSATSPSRSDDPSTVTWWLKQSDEARAEFARPSVSIGVALDLFRVWLQHVALPSPSRVSIWGNGADFDNVILANAYTRAGQTPPWSHWNNRCYRTIKSTTQGLAIERTGTHHCAVDDAESQARHLIELIGQPEEA